MTEKISSSANSRIKFVKSLLQKKNRAKNGLYTVEGIKSVNDAKNAGADIKMIFVSDEYSDFDENSFDCDCFIVPDGIFASLCDTKTPQGILAVLAIDKREFLPQKDKMYICCDNVRDPGNLGTIIRTADAAGFGGVILFGDCADLHSPKTVRSSMGSFFHIPVYENISRSDILKMKQSGFRVLCGALCEDTVNYTEVDFTKAFVICVGNEANGISEDMAALADFTIKIPIFGSAESLNVGIAAAVLMYEAVRQRNITGVKKNEHCKH